MSAQKKHVLLLQKDGVQTWVSFFDEDSAADDSHIYKEQGFEVVGRAEIEIKDEFPCHSLRGYSNEEAKRFGEIYTNDPKFKVVGAIGNFEFTRLDLFELRDWIVKACDYVGQDEKEEEKLPF